ncbi:dephospho-CoA kinase [Actinophytocola gossypii]|uniref:Dephospho-CoA kinase n=1 Tax=Actinophytocola gossypii TaxID=2812003 RepID=A0ABT2JGV8_9PSEU|nr:dephospho-CoA kinase [Actinophytocola gossypii]MCT2587122.1 dephospho-CoA kinase [Actinophytocola gossypii]
MLRVGLTGGIGSGKSTVSGRLAEHGAVVIDADRIAREVVEPGTPGLAQLADAFGSGILDRSGSLDRAALATVVFADDAARQRLNGIVHPLIGERTAELMNAAPADAIVVHDVPLLVENGLAPAYHLVIVVDAPVDTRVERVTRDRGMSEADTRARIAAQATEQARRAVADVWLDNGGPVDQVLADVDALWADRLVRYEANIRLGQYNRSGGPRLVPPDPTWPTQADRLAARVRTAIGDLDARVDHIGSTAVPGLPAKDVVDLQLTVDSMDQADNLADALAQAGFPRHPRIDRDNPKPYAPDPAQWPKRLHLSADPGRLVNLHVRAEGSPGWRLALLIPAWLRADESARAEYRALKEHLADRFGADDDIDRYVEAKEPWFDQAATRAEDWAQRTGWTP